jgi:hypothetical protein
MNTKYKVEIATVEPYCWTNDGKPVEYFANSYDKLFDALFDTEEDGLRALYQYYHDNDVNVSDVSGTYNHCVQNGGDYILLLSDGEFDDEIRCVRIVEMEIDY